MTAAEASKKIVGAICKSFCGDLARLIREKLPAALRAFLAVGMLATQIATSAQGLEVKRSNPSEWTKGRFTEIVTVTGLGKTIYLAGVRAEDETVPSGQSASILHLGNPY